MISLSFSRVSFSCYIPEQGVMVDRLAWRFNISPFNMNELSSNGGKIGSGNVRCIWWVSDHMEVKVEDTCDVFVGTAVNILIATFQA